MRPERNPPSPPRARCGGSLAGALPALPLLAAVALVPLPGLAADGAGPDAALSASDPSATADSLYRSALERIDAGEHAAALALLRRLQREHPEFPDAAAVQARVAVLQEAPDAGAALAPFLAALERRDAGEIEPAVEALVALADAHPASSLADDALYLAAYFLVLDRYEFARAREALLALGRRFPDTAYRDAAIYLDAIALEQLGETEAARTALAVLRDRHTALALPFAFRWPLGNVFSRYWFDRAERRLGIIERRLAEASTLGARAPYGTDGLSVDVSVDGIDMTLALAPSALVRDTDWLDAGLADRAPPALGVYEGQVLGHEGSWVRAIVREDAITGLLEIDGRRHRLLPANLVGTLDYYLPESRRPSAGDGSTLAEMLGGRDALVAPPALGGARPGLAAASSPSSAVRAVPLSVVIDSQYDRYHGGGGLAAALNDLNVADGIYRDFGLALTLDEVLTFDAERDPMALGPVTLETMLKDFRDYRLAQRTLFEGSALTYLFSGNPKTDVTLGLAWIDTLCRVDGYDVGVTTPSSFGDVLLTHELAHSFGALHDSDTACRGESGYLMWPNISERTPTALSPCSETSVRGARTRSCLLDAVDLGLALETQGAALRFVAENPDPALTLDATLVVETGAAGAVDWPRGCRVQTPTSARCALPALAPGERRELLLPRTAVANDAVRGELLPLGVVELAADDNVATAGGDGTRLAAVEGGSLPRLIDVEAGELGGAGTTPSLGGAGGGGALSAAFAALALLPLSAARCSRRRDVRRVSPRR